MRPITATNSADSACQLGQTIRPRSPRIRLTRDSADSIGFFCSHFDLSDSFSLLILPLRPGMHFLSLPSLMRCSPSNHPPSSSSACHSHSYCQNARAELSSSPPSASSFCPYEATKKQQMEKQNQKRDIRLSHFWATRKGGPMSSTCALV